MTQRVAHCGTWGTTQTPTSLREDLHEFACCIQDGTQPEVGGREGMEAVAVIEAIVRSSDTGRAVPLMDLLQGGSSSG